MPVVDEPLPISVAIICCNNEQTIGRTLDSVRGLARQIVAVDSGSTDGTLDLLEKAGAEIIKQEWMGYKETKQFAMEQCRERWMLSLDSDESLEPELQTSIRDLVLNDDPHIAGYELNRKVWWAGEPLRFAWQPEWRLRLVRAGVSRWVGRNPHDKLDFIDPKSRSQRLTGDLRHDAFLSMEDYLRKNLNHSAVGARHHFLDGRRGRISRLVTSPISAWLKQMVLRQAWRDGWRGFSAASATAASALMKHLILLEMTRLNNAHDHRRENDDA